MVEPLRFPIVHKVSVAHTLVGRSAAALLPLLSPRAPIVLQALPLPPRLLGYEVRVSLEGGAA